MTGVQTCALPICVQNGEHPLSDELRRNIESDLHHAESSEALGQKAASRETPDIAYAEDRWNEAQYLRKTAGDFYRKFTGFEPDGDWWKPREAPWKQSAKEAVEPAPHFAESILGLKPTKAKGSLYQKLQGFDVDKVEDHAGIQDLLDKTNLVIPKAKIGRAHV